MSEYPSDWIPEDQECPALSCPRCERKGTVREYRSDRTARKAGYTHWCEHCCIHRPHRSGNEAYAFVLEGAPR